MTVSTGNNTGSPGEVVALRLSRQFMNLFEAENGNPFQAVATNAPTPSHWIDHPPITLQQVMDMYDSLPQHPDQLRVPITRTFSFAGDEVSWIDVDSIHEISSVSDDRYTSIGFNVDWKIYSKPAEVFNLNVLAGFMSEEAGYQYIKKHCKQVVLSPQMILYGFRKHADFIAETLKEVPGTGVAVMCRKREGHATGISWCYQLERSNLLGLNDIRMATSYAWGDEIDFHNGSSCSFITDLDHIYGLGLVDLVVMEVE